MAKSSWREGCVPYSQISKASAHLTALPFQQRDTILESVVLGAPPERLP